jgi:hypothetical protein
MNNKDMKAYLHAKHPTFCDILKRCGMKETMCDLLDSQRLDYLIIIPGIVALTSMTREKDTKKLVILLAPYIVVFKRDRNRRRGSRSYQTLLKNKRKTITYLDDGRIETGDGTVAREDVESDGRVYEVEDEDLEGVDKQSNARGQMQSVEPSLIDIENDEDPNLAVVKVEDKTTQFNCVYCGRGHLSMQKEVSSKLTFCNSTCQEAFHQ